jgi:hypothetical protein
MNDTAHIDSRAVEVAQAPTVTFRTPQGPRAFPVPPLVVLQAIEATPAIGRALPALARLMALRRKLPSLFGPGPAGSDTMVLKDSTGYDWITELSVSAEEYRGMLDAVYWGIYGGTPSLKREEFNLFRISLFELLGAFMIVVQQSDMFEFGPAPKGAASAGELTEGERSPPSTGVA